MTGKRRCEDFVSVEVFDIFGQRRNMESCGDVSWEDLLEEPEDLSDREPLSCKLVRVVPDVIDVLVSPSSVVTELCDVSPCCSDCEFVEPQSFSFSKKACTFFYRYAGRDEVRRLTSDSASTFKKKDDEACRGRSSPLEWRRGRRSNQYRIRKWREECWAIIFAWI